MSGKERSRMRGAITYLPNQNRAVNLISNPLSRLVVGQQSARTELDSVKIRGMEGGGGC